MTRPRYVSLALAIATCALAAGCLYLWHQLRDERETNAKLVALLDAGAISADLADSGDAAASPVAEAAAQSAGAMATPASAAPATIVVQEGAHDEQAYMRQMLQQPKYREAWRAQQRLNYAARRERLIRLLDFTPEQANAAIEITIDRLLSWMDRNPPESITPAQVEQDEREDQARLRELLGEEKLARYKQYLESTATRMQVYELRSQFTGGDALRDDQIEPLIAALHVERAKMQRTLKEFRETVDWNDDKSGQKYQDLQINLLRSTYEEMHAAAAPVLSNTQLDRLDVLLKRDLAKQETEARMNGLQTSVD